MDKISNDNNFVDAIQIGSLIDTTSNSKLFGFYGYYIHSMIKSLDDWCYKLKILELVKRVNLVLG